MLVLYIIILMFTNSLNHLKKNIHSIYINRITILTLMVSILLSFNTLYFQFIGKGIGLYSGLFQVTIQSHIIEIFLLLIGISILFTWPLLANSQLTKDSTDIDNFHEEVDIKNNLSLSKSDQYSLIAIFSILGGSLLMSSLDLLSMYLSIELQSFALYILATLNKDKLSSTSAGLKYFLLGGLSSCFILLGAGVIYTYTGLTHLESIHSLFSIPSIEFTDINRAFTIGLILILVGFLFKISAAPFYQWAPDVYDGVPTIVTVWLTIVAKLTIVIFLQSLLDLSIPQLTLSEILPNLSNNKVGLVDWTSWEGILDHMNESAYIIKNLLLISSLLSLIIGTVAGLAQTKVKRLLAFSSVSHVGFLLLALGIYSPKSIDSFIFYIIQYSVTSLNIFLILLAFGYIINKFIFQERDNNSRDLNTASIEGSKPNWNNFGSPVETDINYLVELRGQLKFNIVLSTSLAICLFSMAGIPPLIGFFSKQFVLFSSIENGNNFLSIIAILVSVISASYYLKLIKFTFFLSSSSDSSAHKWPNQLISLLTLSPLVKKEIKEEGGPVGSLQLELSSIHSYIIAILTFMILFFFVNPSILLNITQLISLTIFNV